MDYSEPSRCATEHNDDDHDHEAEERTGHHAGGIHERTPSKGGAGGGVKAAERGWVCDRAQSPGSCVILNARAAATPPTNSATR